MHDFLLHLVLNHSVVVEKVRNEEGEVVNTRLSASSPDEEAFVLAGRFFGCVRPCPVRRGAACVLTHACGRRSVCRAAATSS